MDTFLKHTGLLLVLFITIGYTYGENDLVQYNIEEDILQGHLIGTIPFSAGLPLNGGTFTLINVPKEYGYLFTLDGDTGNLTTSSYIDRDTICASKMTCKFTLHVSASYGLQAQSTRIIRVVIEILDKNDHTPSFTPRVMTRHFSEGADIGDSVTLDTASDPDSPQNGIQYYMLQGTDVFSLKVTNSSGQSYIQLLLETPLDHETQAEHRMTLLAVDGGSPARTGSAEVVIKVDDINDNRPVFQNDSYVVRVREDIAVDSEVCVVKADDDDSPPNDVITYSFNARTLLDYQSIFSIDSSTGVISNLVRLDYSLGPTIRLGVTASDKVSSLPAEAQVWIHIEDLNDHAPEITATGQVDHIRFSAQENNAPGSFVGLVTVDDKDGGQNGKVTCTMSSEIFSLRPYPALETLHEIKTLTVLDREHIPQHQVELQCSDHGEPSLTAVAVITIDVSDVNDNSPVFDRQTYTHLLSESVSVGTSVLTVKADDDDVDNNGDVTYDLIGADAAFFHIAHVTGEITTASRLDYERAPVLEVTVIASDGGQPPRSTTATVMISLQDEDDEPPRFSKPQYNFSVRENNPPNLILGNLSASDSDTPSIGLTPSFTYSLSPLSNPLGLFSIDPDLGTLKVVKTLDAEEYRRYTVMARAVSKNTNPPQMSEVPVTINVIDVNDHVPVITHPSPGNNTLHIPANAAPGTYIARVEALDEDVGPVLEGNYQTQANQLLYAITRGNSEELFAVGERSGEIHTRKTISSHSGKRYQLVLTVYDEGIPPKSANTTLTIVITDPYSSGAIKGSSSGNGTIVKDRNLVIVIAIACVTGVIAVILLVAIAALLRHRGLAGKQDQRALVDQSGLSFDRRGLAGDKGLTKVHVDSVNRDGSNNAPSSGSDKNNAQGQHEAWLYDAALRLRSPDNSSELQMSENGWKPIPQNKPQVVMDTDQVSTADSGRGSNEDMGHNNIPRSSLSSSTYQGQDNRHRNKHTQNLPSNSRHMIPAYDGETNPPFIPPRASRTPSIQSHQSQPYNTHHLTSLPTRSLSDRSTPDIHSLRSTNQDPLYATSANHNRPMWSHVTLKEQNEITPSHV